MRRALGLLLALALLAPLAWPVAGMVRLEPDHIAWPFLGIETITNECDGPVVCQPGGVPAGH